jgi:hypothetical protein
MRMVDQLKSMPSTQAGAYEQFLAAFVEECNRQGREPLSYDDQTRSMVFRDPKGAKHRVNLENYFRVWHQSDAKARADQLPSVVRSLGELYGLLGTNPLAIPGELRPVIWPRVKISHALIQARTFDAPEGNSSEVAWTPFCGELAACIVRDLPDNMQPITWSNLDFAELSLKQATAQAMTQFRVKAPAPEFLPAPRMEGLFYSINFEVYQSSLLLMTPGKDFVFPPLDGDAVALAPTRNQFFVTGHRNQRALKVLLNLAEGAGQEPHLCSSALLIWRDGRWDEFLFEAGTDEAIKQRQIALRELESDYNQQKKLLDQLHKTRDADIYVSEFTVYQKINQPGSEFSVTVLASGTAGALLPEASHLSFVNQVIDPKSGLAQEVRECLIVPWPIAMDFAGHLFEQVPNLYPPRYRALGFPSGGIWDKLRERAVN